MFKEDKKEDNIFIFFQRTLLPPLPEVAGGGGVGKVGHLKREGHLRDDVLYFVQRTLTLMGGQR
jgi:hypothetical protein